MTGLVAVWLTTREDPWCWPVGLVNVLLYAVVFHGAKLYADMGLQLVYAALCVDGWKRWRGGLVAPGAALAVSRAPRRRIAAWLAAGAAFAVLLGSTLRKATDASLPFWDAGTTSFSLVAQLFQTRKWLENWPLWIAVDAVYVGLYLAKGLALTAGLYALLLVLAGMGWRRWRRSLAT